MVDYNAQPPSAGGGLMPSNYSYNAPVTPPVKNGVSGVGSIADALINGYFAHQGAQNGQSQTGGPMQLQGATAQPGFLANLFGQGAPAPMIATAPPDPSVGGGVY